MSAILDYLWKMSVYMLAAAIVYVIVRKVHFKKTDKKPNLVKECCAMFLIAWAVGILSQTIFPQIDCGVTENGFYLDFKFLPGIIFGYENGGFDFDIMPYAERSINLVPFKTVSEFLGSNEDSPFPERVWRTRRAINLLGNTLLFSPLGFLLPLATEKAKKIGKIFLIGSAYVLFIEITQYFIYRVCDIDDYILNIAGILFGFAVYKILCLIAIKIKS